MDPLFRECDINYLSSCIIRVRPNLVRIRERGQFTLKSEVNQETISIIKTFIPFTESYGGVKSVIQNHYHLSMVPALVGHSVFEQEGLVGGKNHVLPLGGLLSRIRW